MNEITIGLLTLLAGIGLGFFFFGGLWWTLRRGLDARRPALWFLGSLLVRTAGVLAGFYYVSGGRWERMLPCLLGFVLAKITLVYLKPGWTAPRQEQKQTSHETESR